MKKYAAFAALLVSLLTFSGRAAAITTPRAGAQMAMPVEIEIARITESALTPALIGAWNIEPAIYVEYDEDTTLYFGARLRAEPLGRSAKPFTSSDAAAERLEHIRVEISSVDVRLLGNHVTLYYLNNGALVSRTLVPVSATEGSLVLALSAADDRAQQHAADALPALRAGETYYLHFAGKTIRSGSGKCTIRLIEDQAESLRRVASPTSVSPDDIRAGATVYDTDARIAYRVVKAVSDADIPGITSGSGANQYIVYSPDNRELLRFVTGANGVFLGFAKAKNADGSNVLGLTRNETGDAVKYYYYGSGDEAISQNDLVNAVSAFGFRLSGMDAPSDSDFTEASGLLRELSIVFNVKTPVMNSPLPTPGYRTDDDEPANLPRTGTGMSGVYLILMASASMFLGVKAYKEMRKEH